jgi:hypothetical protein
MLWGAFAVAALNAWLPLREARRFCSWVINLPPESLPVFRQIVRAPIVARLSLWPG